MRRSVLRQNNNYPFWTSRLHTWFVAWEGEIVFGFVPVDYRRHAKINNYYVSGDDPRLIARFGEIRGATTATIRSVPLR